MNHLLRAGDITKEEVLAIFAKADEFLPTVKEKKSLNLAEGKILATLFYEPSTRTRFSFETAMLRLGGKVISNADMGATSSAKKGETLYDTAKMVSTFANIIAMRHPEKGSVAEFARGSNVPVVNGGDGAGDHPTQGLLDIYTIWKKFGKFEGLTIGMIGDLKNGRVPHSQCEFLKNFPGIKFIFVAPAELQMPDEIVAELKDAGFDVEMTEDLSALISEMDVIADTRIQQERFSSEAEYLKFKGVYILDAAMMSKAKKDAILMHPLPRVDEIAVEVDNDPRAKYFEQVENGVAVRMALIAKLLGL
jgi:aspartate carbamoyltransferase catalytic subunit